MLTLSSLRQGATLNPHTNEKTPTRHARPQFTGTNTGTSSGDQVTLSNPVNPNKKPDDAESSFTTKVTERNSIPASWRILLEHNNAFAGYALLTPALLKDNTINGKKIAVLESLMTEGDGNDFAHHVIDASIETAKAKGFQYIAISDRKTDATYFTQNQFEPTNPSASKHGAIAQYLVDTSLQCGKNFKHTQYFKLQTNRPSTTKAKDPQFTKKGCNYSILTSNSPSEHAINQARTHTQQNTSPRFTRLKHQASDTVDIRFGSQAAANGKASTPITFPCTKSAGNWVINACQESTRVGHILISPLRISNLEGLSKKVAVLGPPIIRENKNNLTSDLINKAIKEAQSAKVIKNMRFKSFQFLIIQKSEGIPKHELENAGFKDILDVPLSLRNHDDKAPDELSQELEKSALPIDAHTMWLAL